MFRDLPAYEAYTWAGHQAIPDTPAHWDVKTMRSVLTARSERNRADLPLMSVARERGVFVRRAEDENRNSIPDDLSNYKVARQGDLVVNKMKAWQGSLGLAPVDGIVSPAYFVFDLEMHDRDYGQYLLRSKIYVALMAAASDGVRVGQWDLVMSRFRQIPVLVPPAAEQAAIATYLRHAHERIDRAIAAKRRLMALLDEHRQSIAFACVTGGAESAIGWLTQLPTHWQVARAGRLFREINDRSVLGSETALSMSQRLGLVRSELVERSLTASSMAGGKLVEAGDIVLNRLKAHLGVFAVADEPGVVSPDYTVLRPRDGANVRYYEALFRSAAIRGELRRRAKGIVEGFWRLYTSDFAEILIPVPPPHEQEQIVGSLLIETSEIRKAAERTGAEIELLREFRMRLTADVVTGQIDVRGIAATLPPRAGSDAPTDTEAASDSDFEEDRTNSDEH